jgi:hypothetical protein
MQPRIAAVLATPGADELVSTALERHATLRAHTLAGLAVQLPVRLAPSSSQYFTAATIATQAVSVSKVRSLRSSSASRAGAGLSKTPDLVFAATEQERAMSLGNEVDAVFRREVKSLPAYEKAQATSGSGIAPPVDEMNQLLMGLVIAAQRSLHLLADRIEQIENAKAR